MHWQDDAILLNVQPHGEHGAIITVLSQENGRYRGYVRGGMSARLRPTVQVGNRVRANWSARISEQLGNFTLELLENHSAPTMHHAGRLHALSSACAIMDSTLPEREPAPQFYADFQALLVVLSHPAWLANYCKWELSLLSHLGFTLNFSKCNATGQTHDLTYVSPKSGCAVCTDSGKPYHDRLLPLPQFLLNGGDGDMPQYDQSLTLSQNFLQKLSLGHAMLEIPPARHRLKQWVTTQAQTPKTPEK